MLYEGGWEKDAGYVYSARSTVMGSRLVSRGAGT